MLYVNSIGSPSERSLFRRSFDLQARREKRLKLAKHDKVNTYCPIVVEYSVGIKHYRQYEL